MNEGEYIPVQGACPLHSGDTMEIETRLTFDEDGRYSGGEAHVTIEGETAPATKAATCTDCGGPLDDGRYYRCRHCTELEWLAIAQEMGVDWVARHRGT